MSQRSNVRYQAGTAVVKRRGGEETKSVRCRLDCIESDSRTTNFGLATPTANAYTSKRPSGPRRKTGPLFLAGYGVEAETLSLDCLRKKGEMVSLTPVSTLHFPIATLEVEN